MYKPKTILLLPLITPKVHKKLWEMIEVRRRRDCWKFNGYHKKDGYPQVSAGNRNVRVSRLVYTITFGEIRRGMVLDHLCRNRKCVNPYHLEIVTHAENRRRGKLGEFR